MRAFSRAPRRWRRCEIFAISIFRDDTKWTDDNDDDLPPTTSLALDRLIPVEARAGQMEIRIPFISDAYYCPAQLCGPPERCYPEESSEERWLAGNAEVRFGNQRADLSKTYSEELWDRYEKDILAKDVEYAPDDRDEP